MSAKPVSQSESTAPALLRAQATNATLKLRPWGGTRLWHGRGLDHPQRGCPLGEAWEFSTLEGSESYSEGLPLRQLLGHSLPFLAKLVDVQRPLSVQVHPNPQAAENHAGKEEAWVVLDAAPNAQILAGLRPGVRETDLAKAIESAQDSQGEQDAVFDCLISHDVKPGTVVLIPPQTIHTIPSEVFIAEIQDPFDITYRFFDYGSERTLHRTQAFRALDPDSQPVIWHPDDSLVQHNLRGQRVRLCAFGTGTHLVSWNEGERLLVSVRGQSEVRCGNSSEALISGQMRLAIQSPLTLNVPQGGQVVLTWLETSA